MNISENYQRLREEIPDYVSIIVAGKTRTVKELAEVIDAGATNIGENYVQEGDAIYKQLGDKAKEVRWHMIGALQKNKINKAIAFFDIIQTVDSFMLAEALDRKAKRIGKVIPVYVEINSGREPQKTGIMLEDTENLVKQMVLLKNIKIEGVMTMGPRFGNPEDARPYFVETRKIFEHIKCLSDTDIKVLSMGMSNSYKAAIEEGSNMVRLGTIIFGERK